MRIERGVGLRHLPLELGQQPVGPPDEHPAVPDVAAAVEKGLRGLQVGLLAEAGRLVDPESVDDLLRRAELDVAETGVGTRAA